MFNEEQNSIENVRDNCDSCLYEKVVCMQFGVCLLDEQESIKISHKGD